jgi:WD40 repeat protein
MDKTIRLWDVASGRELRCLHGHLNSVWSVAFSPDGNTVVSGSVDNTLRLWNVASGQCVAILFTTADGWVAFTPDGRYKFGGNLGGSFWHIVGLCRFEVGEIDKFLSHLRIPDDEPLVLPPNTLT